MAVDSVGESLNEAADSLENAGGILIADSIAKAKSPLFVDIPGKRFPRSRFGQWFLLQVEGGHEEAQGTRYQKSAERLRRDAKVG